MRSCDWLAFRKANSSGDAICKLPKREPIVIFNKNLSRIWSPDHRGERRHRLTNLPIGPRFCLKYSCSRQCAPTLDRMSSPSEDMKFASTPRVAREAGPHPDRDGLPLRDRSRASLCDRERGKNVCLLMLEVLALGFGITVSELMKRV
jgi:hypothetical protein